MAIFKILEFDGGEYGIDKLSSIKKKELDAALKIIEGKLRDHPNTKYDLIIQGSESLVTNPPGFERKGSLGDARAKAVYDYINTNYNIIITESIPPNSRVKITIPDSKIGEKEYDSTKDNKGDKEYKKDQYVEITIQQDITTLITSRNICDEIPVSVTITKPVIPADFLLDYSEFSFPDDFKNGFFELTLESLSFPDAMEMRIISKSLETSRTAWIPLFASTIEGRDSEQEARRTKSLIKLYEIYQTNPTSPLFTYLPIIRAEGIYRNPETGKINPRNVFTYKFTSSINPSQAEYNTRETAPWKKVISQLVNYETIPLYNIADQDISIYPPDYPTEQKVKILPTLTFYGGYERQVILKKTENDVGVELRVYGFLEETTFYFRTRCIRGTR